MQRQLKAAFQARPSLLALLLFYLLHIGIAALGQSTAIIPDTSISFWPPAGLMVGMLLLSGRASWAWWILAAGLAEMTENALWFGNPPPMALLYFIANACEVVVAALLLSRLMGSPIQIKTMRDTLVFILLGPGFAPMVGATLIAAIEALRGRYPFFTAWPLIWLGDSTGILVIAPLMLVIADFWGSRKHTTYLRFVEPLLILAAVLAILVASMYTWQHVAYYTLPLLVWLAVRNRFAGAVASIALIALVSSVLIYHRAGLFADNPELWKLRIVMLQGYFAVSSLVTLLVAGLAQQHEVALSHLRNANIDLESKVLQRTRHLKTNEEKLQLALESAEAGTWSWTEATQEFEWDQRFQAAHGIPEGSARSLDTWFQSLSKDQDRFKENFNAFKQQPTASLWKEEYSVSNPDLGGERWMLTMGKAERDANGALLSLTGINLDITNRKSHEDKLRVLMRESLHRKKNLLAVVMAIARNTTAGTTAVYRARLQERISSLAASSELLINNAWRGVDLAKLVRLQFAHLEDLIDRRIYFSGPPINISSTASQPLGMALHELLTNAVKYGALSNKVGSVHIDWEIHDAKGPDGRLFKMSWTESGGPPVVKPARRGFGNTVIEKVISSAFQADVAIEYRREGLVWRMSCPFAQIVAEGSGANEATAAPREP